MEKGLRFERLVAAINSIFRVVPDPYVAHKACEAVLLDFAAVRELFQYALRTRPALLMGQGSYPQPGMELVSKSRFTLALNCWPPHPLAREDVATKTVHHHGKLLLTTVCLYGPGYEHWLFKPPRRLQDEDFEISLDSVTTHGVGSTAFVDRYCPHCPFHPPSLSVTLALWSSSEADSLVSHAKRIPLVSLLRGPLAKSARQLGIDRGLGMNQLDYLDYYPAGDRFRGMRVRQEYPRGSNSDHLHNIVHILQHTGNPILVPALVRTGEQLRMKPESRTVLASLARRVEHAEEIPFVRWNGHEQEHTSFSKQDVRVASGAEGRA